MNIFKTKVFAAAGISKTNQIEAVAKSRDNIFCRIIYSIHIFERERENEIHKFVSVM